MSFPSWGGSVNHESSYPCVVERATISGSEFLQRLSVSAFRISERNQAAIDDREVFSMVAERGYRQGQVRAREAMDELR